MTTCMSACSGNSSYRIVAPIIVHVCLYQVGSYRYYPGVVLLVNERKCTARRVDAPIDDGTRDDVLSLPCDVGVRV